MKPTPLISSFTGNSRQDRVSRRRHPCGPRTDHNFQSRPGEHFGDTDSPNGLYPSRQRPSFRDISREFLKEEAPQNFRAEFILFGVIILISAWPLWALAEAWRALPG